MYEHNSFDKKNLVVQLENCKLILEVNSELLENDTYLEEQISSSIGMLVSHLEQLDNGEGNDPIKYNRSLYEANKILKEIKVLIERMLLRDAFPLDDSLQNPAERLGPL